VSGMLRIMKFKNGMDSIISKYTVGLTYSIIFIFQPGRLGG